MLYMVISINNIMPSFLVKLPNIIPIDSIKILYMNTINMNYTLPRMIEPSQLRQVLAAQGPRPALNTIIVIVVNNGTVSVTVVTTACTLGSGALKAGS